MKRILKIIGIILLYLLAAFSLLLAFSAHWALTNWADLKMDELIFELQAPLAGTGNGMIGDYLLKCALPAGAIFAVIVFLMWRAGRRAKADRAAEDTAGRRAKADKAAGDGANRRSFGSRISALRYVILACGTLLLLAGIFIAADRQLSIIEWLRNQSSDSKFIEENYVDPAEAQITFPEKKRNLVYIYLESMETTYTDAANGGAFPENIIPELTELAKENEDFSGASEVLNGGLSLSGTTWTMGAMFAETSGLPLKVEVGANAMSLSDEFFPGIRTLGDILGDEGYAQTLMIGSDATFGGRRQYFSGHGNYAIEDYLFAGKNGLIPEKYKVFWGYEDEKLFAFAKEKLQTLAAGEQPFNLTLLTVDTHFEDGYKCRLCDDRFGDNQYANAIACSSRQTAEFVRWLMAQDYFKDTTIVLSGDHPTMDTDFCDGVSADYTRKVYTCFINAAAEADNTEPRVFSTFDFFPTTIAALGASIEGERLGLGTNLFSGVKTLTEEYGQDGENKELRRKSRLLTQMEAVKNVDPAQKVKASVAADQIDLATGEMMLRIYHIRGLAGDFAGVEAVLSAADGKELARLSSSEITTDGEVFIPLAADPNELLFGQVDVSITDASGNTTLVSEDKSVHSLLGAMDFDYVLHQMRPLVDSGRYAVMLSIRGSQGDYFTDAMAAALQNLGVRSELRNASETSFLAMITKDEVYEELRPALLSHEGVLPGGGTYALVSNGTKDGKESSIIVDGTEYSSGKWGVNLAICDLAENRTIGGMLFDLKTKKPVVHNCKIELGGKLKRFGRIHIRISEANVTKDARLCTVVYWYEDHPEKIRTISLAPGEADDFVGLIKGRLFASAPMHIQPYFINAAGSAKWYTGKEIVTDGGNFIDRLLLPAYANPMYTKQLSPEHVSLWERLPGEEGAKQNYILNDIPPGVRQGVQVSLDADGTMTLSGTNTGGTMYLNCLSPRAVLPDGTYRITDGFEEDAASAGLFGSAYVDGCYMYLEGWKLDEDGTPVEKKILALPENPVFTADHSAWDQYLCIIRVPAGATVENLSFRPGLIPLSEEERAEAQMTEPYEGAALRYYDGDEKMEKFAIFNMKKSTFKKVPEKDYKVFCNNLRYIYNRRYHCKWCTLVFMDGTGLMFEGCDPDKAVYGKVDALGRILEAQGGVEILNGYVSLP